MRYFTKIILFVLFLIPVVSVAQTTGADLPLSVGFEERLALAEQGNAEAQFSVGRTYHSRGTPDRFMQAEKWYRLAAAQGHAQAQYSLGLMYQRGQIESDDEGTGILRALRGLFLRDESSEENERQALEWFRLAAEQGHVPSYFKIGESYDHGFGVEQDHVEAAHWYRLAAEQGDPSAQTFLGTMYESGRGVSQDFEEAARWYGMALSDHSSARFNLALMYRDGRGVPQDNVNAYALLYPLAQGASVPHMKDSAAIIRSLSKEMTSKEIEKAEQTAECEIFGLALCDCEVEVSHSEALGLEGDGEAQARLGYAYYKGWCVEKDDRQAYFWLSMANDNWAERRRTSVNLVILRSLAEGLGPESQAEINQIVRTCVESSYADCTLKH